MSFFKSKPRTAAQKAQQVKSRLMVRGAALAYLIFFIIIPMFRLEPEEAEAMNPTLRYGILAFFILASAALVVLTLLDFIRGRKNGIFSPESYEDDEGV